MRFDWLKTLAESYGGHWELMGKSKEKTLGTWGLIYKGNLVIISGEHGLMGGTLWELIIQIDDVHQEFD